MRLYYHPRSTCSLRVLMAARHLGVKLDLTIVDLLKGEQNTQKFLKLNPNHQVPVLEHDGLVLWESYAIMQYLADITPGQKIYPVELKARADVHRWLFWCAQQFMPGVQLLNWENSIKSLAGIGSPDPAEVARGEQLLKKGAKVLDEHLGDREWVCNTGLSLVDLALAAPLIDEQRAKLPIADFSNLQRWLKQTKKLDCWKVAEEGHPSA